MGNCDYCKHEFGEWCTKYDKDLWLYDDETPEFCNGGYEKIDESEEEKEEW